MPDCLDRPSTQPRCAHDLRNDFAAKSAIFTAEHAAATHEPFCDAGSSATARLSTSDMTYATAQLPLLAVGNDFPQPTLSSAASSATGQASHRMRGDRCL